MALLNQGLSGTHVAYCGDITKTLETAALECQTFCQFFLGSPKSYRRDRVTVEDLNNLQNSPILKRFPMAWCTHAPYMMSLTGYGGKLAWGDDPTATTVLQTKVVPNLRQELSDVYAAGGIGVVVHPGSYGPKTAEYNSCREGLLGVARTLETMDIQQGCVLLENSAGEGSKLPKSLEDFRVILDALPATVLDHVGLCIDTAHLQGVGQYDLSTHQGVDALFACLESLGLPLKLIHYNDSKICLGGRRDLHEAPGFGEIWSRSRDVARYFTAMCHRRNVPFVVECAKDTVCWETILPC